MDIFDHGLADVDLAGHNPPLLEDFNIRSKEVSTMSPDTLVATVYAIFTILKLMSIGHPKSAPYYKEICGKVYPDEDLFACEKALFKKLNSKEYAGKDTTIDAQYKYFSFTT
jgi:hypothetical protein